ncbi:beta-galactosidase [Sphingopyxis panaciterrae]
MIARFISLLAALTLLSEAPASGKPPPFTAAALTMGSSWYPEQWPEDRWDADLALMQRANFTVVRMGEFAWARMEPEDGRFDFGWLDRAIAAAERYNIRVVLGTPTAAPPIWLTEAHPDVRRMEEDSRVQGHGERRQFSVASKTYRRYAARIAAEMARRYGHNPNVVGWQIDNEIGLETFDPEARAGWAGWLAGRYGTIAELNRRWTTEYWSQRYQRFDQVPLSLGREQNPALLLDVRRFLSSEWHDYVAAQASAIRAHADPRQFVTTNSTAWNNHFDQYRVHQPLDIAAWDIYVPDGRPDWAATALHHDVVRGYKRRNFWVMETQPGHVNWGGNNRSLDPGDTRLVAWQAVAHGGDAVLYWQWRSALGGQEQYHGTLVGSDGEPAVIFDEIARTAAEFAKVGALLAETAPRADVAMIYSQDSRWALEGQRFAREYDPVAVMKSWYRPFHERGVTVDVLPPDAELTKYRLVVAPALNLIDRGAAERMIAYVRAGGHLVLGPRSGMKDGDNALWPSRQPGPLSELLSARVESFHALDETVRVIGNDITGIAQTWAESLQSRSTDVKVLARYVGGAWLAGRAAVVTRKVGAGQITYVGALLDDQGQRKISRYALETAAIEYLPILPPGVELVERTGRGRRYLIAINSSDKPASIPLPHGVRAMAGDFNGNILPPKGVGVVELAR